MSNAFFVFLCLSLVSIGMARSVVQDDTNDVESSRRTQEYFKIAMPVKSLFITPTSDLIGSEETKQQYFSKFLFLLI